MMRTPFMRRLMFILLAGFAVLPLLAAPLIAAPAPDTPASLAVFELAPSLDGAPSVTKAVVPNNLELAIFLVNLPETDKYVVFKNNTALQTMRAGGTTQFADNEKSPATIRRGLVINTDDGCSYVLLAINHAMNTQTPLPSTVLAHGNTKTGGSMFQVNTQYDLQASTLQPDSSMGWGAAN